MRYDAARNSAKTRNHESCERTIILHVLRSSMGDIGEALENSACFPHLLDTVQKALMRCMLHRLLAASAIAIIRPYSGRDDVWKTACGLSAPVTSSTIHRTQIERGTYPNFILVANPVLSHLRTNEKCATARKDAPTGETYAEMWRAAITGWSGTDSCLYRLMSGD